MTSYTISEESDNIVLLKELVKEAKAKYGYYQAPHQNNGGRRPPISGFYRVRKYRTKTVKGYTFEYKIQRNGKVTRFHRQDLLDLKKECVRRGLPWEVSNLLLARKLVADEGLDWKDFEK